MLVRPSYVLGGRAMVIAYDEDTVRRYMQEAVVVLAGPPGADRPVPGRRHRSGRGRASPITTAAVLIAGIMEHIEEAGVHSGDSQLRAAAALRLRRKCSTTIRDLHRAAGARAAT